MFYRKQSCVVCGEEIDELVGRTQKYCSDLRCRLKYLEGLCQVWREGKKQKREELNQQVRELRGAVGRRVGIENPEEFIAVAVPVNKRQVGHLSEKGRCSFGERLTELIGEAAAERCSSRCPAGEGTGQKKGDRQAEGGGLGSILSKACAICEGSCCANGDEYGFLRVKTIVRYMEQHPELEEGQVLDKYMSCLPKKTYEDSCVYHTESGCALPGEMRSETCHSFRCDGLVEIEEHAIEGESTRFFIAAMEGKKILRSAFVEENAMITVNK